ncbi:hypothetical protein MMC07_005982 [Pseudocyphellaria aurata]|nr:hypothetical protein [Pseudocyphellaria aurata]
MYRLWANARDLLLMPYTKERDILTMVENARTKYANLGVEFDSIDALVYDEIIRPRSALLLDHIWFEIVDWINSAKSEDPLGKQYAANPWLQAFLPTNDVASTKSAPSEQYKTAASQFDTDPKAFVEALTAFSKNVRLDELCVLLLQALIKHGRDYLECWCKIHTAIDAIPRQEGKSTSESEIQGNDPHSRGALALLSDIGRKDERLNDTAQTVANFLTQSIPRDTRADSRNNQLLLRLHGVLSFQWKSNEFILNISDLLGTLHQQDANTPFPGACSSLLNNVRTFYHREMGIPCEDLTLQVILSKLHTFGAQRRHKYASLINKIDELKEDIADKQRVITCLGFRHVLETLPDQVELGHCFKNWRASSGTASWQKAWKFVVERELVLMLFEKLQELSAAGQVALSIASRAKGLDKSKPLRELFGSDFDNWFKNKGKGAISLKVNANRNANQNDNHKGIDLAIQAYTRFEEAQAAAKDTPPARPQGNILHAPEVAREDKDTQHTALFEKLNLKYYEWNSYMRGVGLYSELSSSIHQYDTFEVHETDWARSDLLILQWLRPDVNANGEVDWTRERVQRGLPFTPPPVADSDR